MHNYLNILDKPLIAVKKFIVFILLFSIIFDANAVYINNLQFGIKGDFFINDDDNFTNSLDVNLDIDVVGVSNMRFGNSIAQLDNAVWETYSSNKSWTLISGDGKKTVYVSLMNNDGSVVTMSDDILYNQSPVLGYTSGLTLWLDSSDESTIISSGGKISSWGDKSGNNYNALQDTSGEQPSILNSEIDFNGTSEYFYIEGLNYQNNNPLDGVLVCGVFKTTHNSSSYNDNWAIIDFDRSEWFDFYNKGGDYGFSFDSDSTIRDLSTSGYGLNNGEWHIACASYNNTVENDTIISINGENGYIGDVEPLGAQIGAGQATRYGFIGDGSEANTQDGSRNNIYYDGGIGELLYFDSVVNDSDRKEVECYLAEKWFIPVDGCVDNLPIGTINYSPKNGTSGSVIANLENLSEDVIITNNGGSSFYEFTENGEFLFEYIDSDGNYGSNLAKVDWIDENILPSIPESGVNSAPEILSYSGSSSVNILVSSGSTYVANVDAQDNNYNIIGEYGKLTLGDNSYQSISHSEVCSPVVVASHRGNVDGEIQRAPRVRNKTGTGFEIKVDNYNSSIGSINTVVDYMVFNSGNYNLGGLKVEAGSVNTSTVACNSNNNPAGTESYNFLNTFDSAPVVLHSISSENDSSWVVSSVNGNDGTRQSEPTVSTMGFRLQRSFESCTHLAEDIDFLAFEPGHYNTTGGFYLDAVRSTDSIAAVSATGYPIDFYNSFTTAPEVALVSQLGEDGGNGGYAQIHTGGGINQSSLFATIDEDGPGADRWHTNEVVSSVAMSSSSGQFLEENTITYSIVGGADSSLFQIDSNSGILEFITGKSPSNPTDSNSDAIYEVTVNVCDSHCNSKCSSQTFNVDVSDTISPTVNSIDILDNQLLPGGNNNFNIYFEDDAIGIDTSSYNIVLNKWSGSLWGSNISSTGTSLNSIDENSANFNLTNLDYGRYRILFEISDLNQNKSLVFERIFYVDRPSFYINNSSYDIGNVDHTGISFTDNIEINVNTVGAGFSLFLKRNESLDSGYKEIMYFDGSEGFGYDGNNSGSLSNFTTENIASELGTLNFDGNYNSYNYEIRLGAIIDELEFAGNYQGTIDFYVEFYY